MSDPLEPGALIAGKYRLDALIGEGGYGTVWRAEQLDLGRTVAVKFLHASVDASTKHRFDREARALGRLNHRNCVTLFDFGHLDDGRSYVVTEHLDGITLFDWIGTQPSANAVTAVARQIASALAHAHHEGIIHRDLKPANVILLDSYGELQVKVLDFGIAKIVEDDRAGVTKTGEVFGTFGYMSPEQLRGEREIGPASDLYALGVLMFEMFEGRSPFEGETAVDMVRMHLMDDAPLSVRAPREVGLVIARLLNKDARDRYRNADAVVVALDPTSDEPRPNPPARTSLRRVSVASDRPDVRIAKIVVVISLVVCLAAAAYIVSVLAGGGRRVSLNRVEQALSTPQKSAAVVPAPESADAGSVRAADTATPATPGTCEGLPTFEVGDLALAAEHGFEPRLRVYLPKSYTPTRLHPWVVMFHDSFQSQNDLLGQTGFRDYADKHGFVLIVPRDRNLGAWDRRGTHRRVFDDLRRVSQLLCVDPARLFSMGFGEGGYPAERLACDREVRAIATMSHRLAPGEHPCEPLNPTPYLFLSPTADGLAPVGDEAETEVSVLNCLGEAKWSLRKHIDILKEHNRCTGADKPLARVGSGAATTWNCEAPLVSWRLDGGRPWPGKAPRISCDGEPTSFGVTEAMWKFFVSQEPR